jgi:hypothetical protein
MGSRVGNPLSTTVLLKEGSFAILQPTEKFLCKASEGHFCKRNQNSRLKTTTQPSTQRVLAIETKTRLIQRKDRSGFSSGEGKETQKTEKDRANNSLRSSSLHFVQRDIDVCNQLRKLYLVFFLLFSHTIRERFSVIH